MDGISTPAVGVRQVSGDQNVSNAVVLAVAEARNVDPLELDPLYDVIDPDALDAIFSSAGPTDNSMELDFEMAGCQVTVRGTGEIRVELSPSEAAAVVDPLEN
ncbi:HalOD1 output domain-containing protein [Haloprofundus halobius]|uniref:HalOD1 output domain-containing protein n=1 Tax=Haloprofundus halobius TaxID=2876194 RepID=UPI001CCF1A75|nr:HalOD1 output domain-containing protein [Haloprofundus halobius]